MSVIYEPKGRAREYGEFAVNLYSGCGHGCIYCYAPAVTYKTREQFVNASPRNKILQDLEIEARFFGGKEITLCFTCDPYQPIDMEHYITRRAIEILHKNNCCVNILTKGGSRSMRDFDLLSKNRQLSKYGATLTFLDSSDSLDYEPFAALPDERFQALQEAHKLGIQTWASLEPVIEPEQTLAIIEKTKDYVDVFKVGKWNHDKESDSIDWRKFLRDVLDILKRNNLKYYIKVDLANNL
ncbi:MAG: hypothetical protein DDT19_01962 [Syntrophomonadaceae bacterium]|nr:hypothetical protein [Bacillota bacterium]